MVDVTDSITKVYNGFVPIDLNATNRLLLSYVISFITFNFRHFYHMMSTFYVPIFKDGYIFVKSTIYFSNCN